MTLSPETCIVGENSGRGRLSRCLGGSFQRGHGRRAVAACGARGRGYRLALGILQIGTQISPALLPDPVLSLQSLTLHQSDQTSHITAPHRNQGVPETARAQTGHPHADLQRTRPPLPCCLPCCLPCVLNLACCAGPLTYWTIYFDGHLSSSCSVLIFCFCTSISFQINEFIYSFFFYQWLWLSSVFPGGLETGTPSSSHSLKLLQPRLVRKDISI